MAIKDILVHVDNAKACEARLRLACDLAGRCRAHLTGTYIVQQITVPMYVETAIPAELFEQAQGALKERRKQAKKLFAKVTAAHKATTEWRTSDEDLAFGLVSQSRYVDLVIVGQADPDDPSDVSAGLADRVALSAGRPVLVVPYVGVPKKVGTNVIVAWNDSRESARAVNDALPILEGAKRVEVVTFNPDSEDFEIAGNDISLHLSRHGVKTESHAMRIADIEVGDALLSRAADIGADLIVMGAYGHSRLREVVLGGVTRHVLAHMTAPVLLSH